MPLCFDCHEIFGKEPGIHKPKYCPVCRARREHLRVNHIRLVSIEKRILKLNIVLDKLKGEVKNVSPAD